MGRERAPRGRWSFKALLSRGIRSKSITRGLDRCSVSDEAQPGSPNAAPAADAAAIPGSPAAANGPSPPAGAAASSPPSTPSASDASTLGAAAAAAEHGGQAKGSVGGRSLSPPASPPQQRGLPLAGKSLMVHLIQARGLRAADSNGLSDPYCVVQVGDHKSSSKKELKTLQPVWNEVMMFSPTDMADAQAARRSHVSLRVFDWDLVSTDDFLGQCEVAFAEVPLVDSAGGSAAGARPDPSWMRLYGYGRNGKRVDAGEVLLAVWYEAAQGAGDQGSAALSTLCSAPGTRRQAPQVVHCMQGSLYEEPLIACLAVTLERVEGLPVPAAAGKVPAGEGSPDASLAALSRISTSSGVHEHAGRHASLLGGMLRWRQRGGRQRPRVSHCYSSDIEFSHEDMMLAGEDAGDEYGASLMDGFDGGLLGHDEAEEGDTPRSSFSDSPSVAGQRFQPSRHSIDDERPGSLRPSGPSGALPPVAEIEPAPGTTPAEAASGGAEVAGVSGMRLYMRLVLGRQKHTSFIRREHLNGTVGWNQTLVFAVPLPMRDRQLRLELYRTPNSSQKGRLVGIAHVWLHDLVPPGLAGDPTAMRHSCVELESVLKHQGGGRARLSTTLVDTDLRRAAYQAPFVEEEAEAVAAAALRAGAAATAAAAVSEAAGRASEVPVASTEAPRGPRRGSEQQVQRLESMTEGLSQRELRKKALSTEESFTEWQESRHHQAKVAAKGFFHRASETAHWAAQEGWNRTSLLLSSPAPPGAADSSAHDPGATQPPPPPLLPRPAGSLVLTVESLSLAGSASSADCFFVLKCGPFWGRSCLLAGAGGTGGVSCGWQLSLPLLDPAALLTLAVFQQPSRSHSASVVLRSGLLVKDAVRDAFSTTLQVVGKLRVRLSCLHPNAELSSELPLLSERAKGARVVGTVRLALQTNYDSAAALVRGYTAPRLPKAAYHHGIDGASHQAVMERERRRICLRWLESANPAISGAVATAVLDTEREAFAMSRARVNARRVQMALVGVRRAKRKLDAIKTWQDPWESAAAMLGILLLCFLPRLAVPALLGWLVLSTLVAQPPDFGLPVPMEQDPPGIEPENESLETSPTNPLAGLKARVERLQRLGLLVQNAADDVASALERVGALLSWQDPTATFLFLLALSAAAALIFLLGLSTVLAFLGCFLIRPPALRTPTPALPAVFFGKLPTRGDRIV